MNAPPKNPHLAWDCVDKHEASWINKHKVALITVSEGQAVKRFTFSQLSGLSHRMARAFAELKLSQGERILLRLPNRVEFPISFLGALKSGALPIPSSPLYTWEELRYLLEDSRAAAFITTPECCPPEIWDQRPPTLKHIILSQEATKPLPPGALRWEDLLKEGSPRPLPYQADLNDPAYWLYTSGTTGRPKAAVHAHRSISAHDHRAARWLGVQAGDVIFNTGALNWSYGLTAGMLDLWRHGLTSVIFDGTPDPQRITEILQRFGVTTLMSVPGIYRRLCRAWGETKPQFSALRVCLSSGENLAEETREEFHNLTGLHLHQGLGMTENSIYLVQPCDEIPVKDSVGQSVFGDQVQILRQDLSPAAPGETGVLATSAQCPGLMLGYHRGEGGLEQPWREGWFLSGDLAYRDEAGNFFFQGRHDDVITAGGYRIAPLEVEQVLNRHPDVLESAVLGEEIEGRTLVAAHVVLRDDAPDQPTLESFQTYCRQFLANYKIPRQILFCKTLPKTVTGKIIRRDIKTSNRD